MQKRGVAMLGIGMWEMALLMGIALVVMGPERFPDFAKIVMRTIRDFRKYMDDIQHEVGKEIRPIQNELKKLGRLEPEQYMDALAKAESEPKTAPTSSPEPESTVMYGPAGEATTETNEPPSSETTSESPPPAPEGQAQDPYRPRTDDEYPD